MDKVMDQFDLLVTRVEALGLQQTQLNDQQAQMREQMNIKDAAMDAYTKEQQLIAQQVRANGAAVAQLTLHHFDHPEGSRDGDFTSVTSSEDYQGEMENVFAAKTSARQAGPSKNKHHRQHHNGRRDRTEKLPHHSMPKMVFPTFDGTHPKVWKDDCESYFDLYKLPQGMWITAAHLHFEGNAATWYQAYKQHHTFNDWAHFCSVVEEEFGSDDFRKALDNLLEIKQQGPVEEYTTQFQALQYQILMHNSQYDDLFFAKQYMKGLKEELRNAVEPQRPISVKEAAIIATIQQGVLDRSKARQHRQANVQKPYQQFNRDNKKKLHHNLNCGRTDNSGTIGKLIICVIHVGRNLCLVIRKCVPKETSHRSMLLY